VRSRRASASSAWSRFRLPWPLQRRFVGPRIDLRDHIALMDQLAFGEQIFCSTPLIWVRTVTLASGVTVPSAGMRI
jgi:hypothetical protein